MKTSMHVLLMAALVFVRNAIVFDGHGNLMSSGISTSSHLGGLCEFWVRPPLSLQLVSGVENFLNDACECLRYVVHVMQDGIVDRCVPDGIMKRSSETTKSPRILFFDLGERRWPPSRLYKA